MLPRERFDAAVGHRTPDRPPIDLGCTSLTGLASGVQARLMALLGLPEDSPRGHNNVAERLLEWAGCDFRAVGGVIPLRGELERAVSATENIDCWGVRRRLVGGYWDIVSPPLKGATVEDLKSFPWPAPELDDALLERLRVQARRRAEETPYVVIAEHPVFGVLELACWMCGYDDFLLRLALDPDFVHAFLDRYFAIQMRVIEQYYGAVGEYADLTMSGDDFGTQSGPLMSPSMFREFIAPYFRERIARTKAIGPRYYWHHSCGSIADLLEDIIACGVDILNPVQTSAAGMVPRALREAAGDRLTFWGAIDVQDLLRTATPSEVTDCVRETITALGERGGYVVAPAHNVQDDVPPENIVAMIEAAKNSANAGR